MELFREKKSNKKCENRDASQPLLPDAMPPLPVSFASYRKSTGQRRPHHAVGVHAKFIIQPDRDFATFIIIIIVLVVVIIVVYQFLGN